MGGSVAYDADLIIQALEMAYADVLYHLPLISMEEVQSRILSNNNETALFLYRLGRLYYQNGGTKFVKQLHGLMRGFCGCEIYFSNEIGEGLLLPHSLGVVIGSRNNIGRGFVVYQNSTIGHMNDFQEGVKIGNDVTVMANSLVLGDVNIGNNVVIGAASMVTEDIKADSVVAGIPSRLLDSNSANIIKKLRSEKYSS